MQRWIEGSKVLVSMGFAAQDDATIEAGEVWLYLASPDVVALAIVMPFHSYKNGLRAWTSLNEKMKLKDAKSIQLRVGTYLAHSHPACHLHPAQWSS